MNSFWRNLKTKSPNWLESAIKCLCFPATAKQTHNIYQCLQKSKEDLCCANYRVFQAEALVSICLFACESSEFYRHIFKDFDFTIKDNQLVNFGSVPFLTKEIIREKYSDLVCHGNRRIDYFRFNTGGSTGEPLVFLISRLNGWVDAVHQQFHFELMGYTPGDRIFAFDGCSVSKTDLADGRYWSLLSRRELPYGSLHFSSHYLSPDTIPFYLEEIRRGRPSFFRGYPSFLHSIARYLLENGDSLRFPLKAVQLTAEQAFPEQIEDIRRAFGAPVYLQYGHSEMGVFGYTADDSFQYTCSPYYGFTEVVDEGGRPVPPGACGEIVVTSYYNRIMPFIRYRTGDWATLESNHNGLVKFRRVEGREQNFIWDRDGRRVSLTGLVFGQHFKSFQHIKSWQIHQDAPGHITIRIVRDASFTEEDAEEIRQKFSLLGNVTAELEFVPTIPLTARGKRLFVVGRMRDIDPHTNDRLDS